MMKMAITETTLTRRTWGAPTHLAVHLAQVHGDVDHPQNLLRSGGRGTRGGESGSLYMGDDPENAVVAPCASSLSFGKKMRLLWTSPAARAGALPNGTVARFRPRLTIRPTRRVPLEKRIFPSELYTRVFRFPPAARSSP